MVAGQIYIFFASTCHKFSSVSISFRPVSLRFHPLTGGGQRTVFEPKRAQRERWSASHGIWILGWVRQDQSGSGRCGPGLGSLHAALVRLGRACDRRAGLPRAETGLSTAPLCAGVLPMSDTQGCSRTGREQVWNGLRVSRPALNWFQPPQQCPNRL